MFGMRTPVKNTSSDDVPLEQTASASDKPPNVRRSVGEWEAGKPIENIKTTPRKPPFTITIKPKPKPMVSLEGKPSIHRKTAEETVNPPTPEKPKYANRVAEARACLNKAKLHLNNSRNLKTDIKTEVTHAVERLYQLVKEAEMERGQTHNREKKREEEEKLGKSHHKEEINGVTMAEHVRKLEENGKKMEELREAMEVHRETLERATYANVLANRDARPAYEKRNTLPSPQHGIQQPVVITSHSIIVASDDCNDTSADVIEKIRTAVDAKTSGIRVDKVRKAKGQKVIIGCGTKEEVNRVSEKIKQSNAKLRVEEARNRNPLIMLKDVLTCNKDDDILQLIKVQNSGLMRNLSEQETEMTVRFRKRTRNLHLNHVVVEVSPRMWQRLTEAGRLHIDLQRVVVTDQSPLVQCSRCLAFGHGRKLCTESVDLCSHCAGPHLRAECPDRLAGHSPACRNCQVSKHSKVDHNAFDIDCPVRKKWDALARSKIAYS